MNFWQPKIETMKKSDLQDLQQRRLKDAVKRAYDNVPFYHQKMKDLGMTPGDVTSLGDARSLPETRKASSPSPRARS